MRTVRVPLIGGCPVNLSNCPQEMGRWISRYAPTKKEEEEALELLDDADGLSLEWTSGDKLHRCMGVFDGRIGTLSHEAMHMSWYIATGASFKVDEGNHEIMAYLSDWLVTTFSTYYSMDNGKPGGRSKTKPTPEGDEDGEVPA